MVTSSLQAEGEGTRTLVSFQDQFENPLYGFKMHLKQICT